MDEDEEGSITDDTRKLEGTGLKWSAISICAFSSALQDLLNNPAGVLVVTRRHVLRSWGFTGRTKPPAVQKKERKKKKRQGAPPTVCELVQKKKKKKAIHFLVYVLRNLNQGFTAPHERGRPACGVNNAPISTPGQGQRSEELS